MRGDIFYADLNPVTGSEQGGIRPVLVIQNNDGNRYSSTFIVAAITAQHKSPLPTHIQISGCGLREKSTILLEQIRTISIQRLRERVGHVTPEIMELVFEALDISFGLSTKREAKEVEIKDLTVKQVEFNGDTLLAVKDNAMGKVYISVNHICNGLGIDAENQRSKLREHMTISKGTTLLGVPSAGGTQSTFVIELEFLPLWLAGINPAKVNPEIQGKLIEYQLKAKDVLAQAFVAQTIKVPQTFAEALRLAADLEEEKQRLLSENTVMKPKAESFDVFMGATGNLKINEVAKTLNIKDVGQNNMFKLLLKEKIIFKEGSGKDAYYLPKQEHESHFVVKQNPVHKGDMVMQRSQIFLTPEGLDWLAKKLIKKGYQVNYGKAKQMSLSN